MTPFPIALANLPVPSSPAESLALASQAIADAARAGARLLCFPECFLPGYRAPGKFVPPPDPAFLERAWAELASASARARITAIVGTERLSAGALIPTALVLTPEGAIDGFQDKVQLDPSEEPVYSPGSSRRIFHAGPLTFGISICHEGWRYPETFRFAARLGAHAVFHPHFHEASPGAFQPTSFADPANTFHEKALLCRAAENTCWVASANCASPGSPTTSAVIRPDGTLLAFQPYGLPGLLLATLDLDEATCLLAKRWKPI